ncbi:MAG: iron ABC transporter permease [Bacteroidales bacterium]|nr:iron ABC transporter permease [Bacteroidales bacterium]
MLITMFFIELFIGSVSISFKEIFNIVFLGISENEANTTIIADFRLPKIITAIVVGIALAVSGLQMQAIFRNPLAGPYVLGISSGAGLGVAILLLSSGWLFNETNFSFLGNWAMVLAAWLGSGIVLFLVLLVSIRVKDVLTVLILGIMFGAAISSLVNILQFFSDQQSLKSYVVWTMGSLGGVTKSQLAVLLPSVIIGLFLSILSAKMLNALLLGENYAKSMGVNVLKARILVFAGASILAGTVTAFCGPIGFVGIVVPHIARIIFRTSNVFTLIWGSSLIGALFMLMSDLLSRIPGSDTVLPINSVTAIIGVPVIIYLVIKKFKFES